MQRFTEAEADEILRRAAQAPIDEYTSDELIRSAAELGISAEAVARAEAEFREDRLREEFEHSLRSGVRGEVLTFLTVMTFLVFINLTTSRQHLWFIYPMLFWGFSVLSTVLRSRDRRGERYKKAFQTWRESEGKISEAKLASVVSDNIVL
jgi:hypothetical protein